MNVRSRYWQQRERDELFADLPWCKTCADCDHSQKLECGECRDLPHNHEKEAA